MGKLLTLQVPPRSVLTPDNKSEILALWRAGFNTADIASLLNFPEYMIAKALPEIRMIRSTEDIA
jgi:hypothetical protein